MNLGPSLIVQTSLILPTEGDSSHYTMDRFDAMCFHSPFCKLVQKSLARLMLNDFMRDPKPDTNDGGRYAGLRGYK